MSDSLTFLIVKGTFALLIFASALTWAVVAAKTFQQLRLGRQNRRFSEKFGRVSRLPSTSELRKWAGPVARVALAGAEAWEEGDRPAQTHYDLGTRRDVLERTLHQQMQRERRGVEAGLPILASIGSTAPFVGLFGTVFGIIHALQRISGAGSASLDVVAGPIGEALVATGIGIAVAVPAVIAYNVFIRRLKGLLADIEDFASTFVNSAVTTTQPVVHVGERSQPRESGLAQEATA